MTGRSRLRAAAGLFAAVSFALFVALNLAFVTSRGVCCADDAFTAVVAKNLARGLGYSTTLGFARPDYVLEPFDAHVTTGPTLVLPVSAVIRVLGNRHWVPGAVHVALWSLLLVAIWLALGAVAGRHRAAATCGVFLLVIYAVSPHSLEHWYGMLGEVPAALAILLGVATWAASPQSASRSFAAAVLCSLAILTKVLAALYGAVFLVSAVAVGLSRRQRPTRPWSLVALPLAGLLLPVLAFEAWKAVSMGLEAYVSHLRTFGGLIVAYGTSRSAFSAAEVTARTIEFSRKFGVSLPGLLVLAVLGGSLAWRAGGAPFRRLHLLLLAGVVVHGCYWLVLSVGWPRYLYIGVVLLAALVAVPYLALDRPAPAILYSGMLVLSLLGTVGRLPFPIRALRGAWFAASPERSSQAIVVRFLDARADRRPFVGQWWGSVADLEYLSDGVLNFKGYPALTRGERSRGVLVVTNRRFDDAADRRFSTLVARCGPPVLNAVPYAVYECGGQRPTPEGRPFP